MTVRNQHQHFIFHDFEAHKRAVILCGLGTWKGNPCTGGEHPLSPLVWRRGWMIQTDLRSLMSVDDCFSLMNQRWIINVKNYPPPPPLRGTRPCLRGRVSYCRIMLNTTWHHIVWCHLYFVCTSEEGGGYSVYSLQSVFRSFILVSSLSWAEHHNANDRFWFIPVLADFISCYCPLLVFSWWWG